MGPKKATKTKSVGSGSNKVKTPAEDASKMNEMANTKRKRKDSEAAQENGNKASRKSTRHEQTAKNEDADAGAKASVAQILHALLSTQGLQLSTPDDETEYIDNASGKSKSKSKSASTQLKVYSRPESLSAFQTLLSAVLLARPISHAIGLRALRTMLNEPEKLDSAQAIKKAGEGEVARVLEEAKMLHRWKAASQVTTMAQVIVDKQGDGDDDEMAWCRDTQEEGDEAVNVDEMRTRLSSAIKGVGKTGLDIFCRRVQARWTEVHPFADAKAVESVKALGLPGDVEELVDALESHWDQVAGELDGVCDDEEEKKRWAFVLVLERATGVELEGHGAALVEAAGGF